MIARILNIRDMMLVEKIKQTKWKKRFIRHFIWNVRYM
jgi:hypothetical protein